MIDHELQLKSVHRRKNTLEAIYEAGAGHTGGSLSCLDFLNVLYNRILNVSPEKMFDPNRDRYAPAKISPQTTKFNYSGDSLHWTFPGDSVTILCLATTKKPHGQQ